MKCIRPGGQLGQNRMLAGQKVCHRREESSPERSPAGKAKNPPGQAVPSRIFAPGFVMIYPDEPIELDPGLRRALGTSHLLFLARPRCRRRRREKNARSIQRWPLRGGRQTGGRFHQSQPAVPQPRQRPTSSCPGPVQSRQMGGGQRQLPQGPSLDQGQGGSGGSPLLSGPSLRCRGRGSSGKIRRQEKKDRGDRSGGRQLCQGVS